jgi:hypothetical protein
MPNFAQSQGGFEGGLAGSNKKVYLAVIEEWSPCAVRIPRMHALSSTDIVLRERWENTSVLHGTRSIITLLSTTNLSKG